jgi:hypothetical protein
MIPEGWDVACVGLIARSNEVRIRSARRSGTPMHRTRIATSVDQSEAGDAATRIALGVSGRSALRTSA